MSVPTVSWRVALIGLTTFAVVGTLATAPSSDVRVVLSRLRAGADEPESSSSSIGSTAINTSRGRGRIPRGRGRGRGSPGYYSRPSPQPLNTELMGDVIRNLTTWQDVDASRAAFVVGNAVFASFFIGRKAVLLLWLAFIATFIMRSPLQLDNMESIAAAAREAVSACAEVVKAATAAVRERLSPAPAA